MLQEVNWDYAKCSSSQLVVNAATSGMTSNRLIQSKYRYPARDTAVDFESRCTAGAPGRTHGSSCRPTASENDTRAMAATLVMSATRERHLKTFKC